MNVLFQSITRPAEIQALYKLKFEGLIRKVSKAPLEEQAKTLSDLDFCYAILNKVSRSFAVVIQQLPEELKDVVCVFYLALRGLDSVEDDMTLDLAVKVPLLYEFHNHMQKADWRLEGIGDGPDYRVLLAHYPKVTAVYHTLDPRYQAIIQGITQRMGAGMAKFAKAESDTCATCEEYDEYCHYVAGLVGYGLSDLFAASGLESTELQAQTAVSNSMGLFLQKTNIVRDYLEDLVEGRTWWPTEIWSLYAKDLSSLRDAPASPASIACLNHMVTDALRHAPDCLNYLASLKNPKVFVFCAVPQVMAIATLSEVYNNPKVYTQECKIRKGLAARLMLNSRSMAEVKATFTDFARSMQRRVPRSDPHAEETHRLLKTILDTCEVRPASKARSATSHNAQLAVTKNQLEPFNVGFHLVSLVTLGALLFSANLGMWLPVFQNFGIIGRP